MLRLTASGAASSSFCIVGSCPILVYPPWPAIRPLSREWCASRFVVFGSIVRGWGGAGLSKTSAPAASVSSHPDIGRITK